MVLSFDDGPNPHTTPHILDTLQIQNVTAVFFLVGINMVNQSLLHRIVDEGHLIGSHTDNHANLTNVQNITSELDLVEDIMNSTFGEMPRLIRPPYGCVNDSVKAELYKRQYMVLMWNCDPRDWEFSRVDQAGAMRDQAVGTIAQTSKKGKFVLEHELASTVAALEEVIIRVRNEGYEFTHPVCVFDQLQLDYLWLVSDCNVKGWNMWCRCILERDLLCSSGLSLSAFHQKLLLFFSSLYLFF